MSADLPLDLPSVSGKARMDLPPVEAVRLPNGLEVRVLAREGLPLASVRLVIFGGRSDDAPQEAGFADLLAACLKEGSANRTGAQVAESLQEAGASLEAEGDEDALSLRATCLPDRIGIVLSALGEVITSPGFREADVARVRALAAEELATRETEPSFLAERALARALYAGHPYAAIAPAAATIDSLDPAALQAAARRRLSPSRAILFVVGAVKTAPVAAAAAAAFGAWSAEGPAPEPAPRVPRREPGLVVTLVPRPGSVQTMLLAGTVAPPRTTPDAAALVLANAVYGGAFSSRLVEKLREEKGYSYSPGSRLRFRRSGGPFAISAAVRNEVTGAALAEILGELRRMVADPVTQEELERARARETGALASAVQTNEGLAFELGRLAVDGLGAEALAELVAGFGSATGDELNAAASLHLAGPGLHVVAVGERETIRRELSPFGTELLEDSP